MVAMVNSDGLGYASPAERPAGLFGWVVSGLAWLQYQEDNHQGCQADCDVDKFSEVDLGQKRKCHIHGDTVTVGLVLAIGESGNVSGRLRILRSRPV